MRIDIQATLNMTMAAPNMIAFSNITSLLLPLKSYCPNIGRPAWWLLHAWPQQYELVPALSCVRHCPWCPLRAWPHIGGREAIRTWGSEHIRCRRSYASSQQYLVPFLHIVQPCRHLMMPMPVVSCLIAACIQPLTIANVRTRRFVQYLGNVRHFAIWCILGQLPQFCCYAPNYWLLKHPS